MPKYETELEIPFFRDPRELQQWVEALREFGHPKIIFRVEGASRHEIVNEVANSCSVWWPRFDSDYWNRKLRVIRGKRAQQEI